MQTDNRRRNILRGSAVAATAASWPLITSTARAQKAEHTMKIGYSFSLASEKFVATAIARFKELAEKATGGRLAVEIFPGGVLGDQGVMVQKVQQGVIQATQVSMANFTAFSPSYNVLDFPYLFKGDVRVFEKFLEDPFLVRSTFATEPEAKGLKVLPGMWASFGMRQLGISKKKGVEVRRPGDLRGVKVRVTASKIEQQAFALTPGSPVSINWGETYQAMQQGACDAVNVAMAPLQAYRISETLGSFTQIDATPNAHVTVMNAQWFGALPGPVKDAIMKAAADAWEWQKAEQRKIDAATAGIWKAAGVKFVTSTPDERKEWISAIGHQRSDYNQWKDRFGRDLYDKTVAVVEKLG